MERRASLTHNPQLEGTGFLSGLLPRRIAYTTAIDFLLAFS
jgi:hypothetical protein